MSKEIKRAKTPVSDVINRLYTLKKLKEPENKELTLKPTILPYNLGKAGEYLEETDVQNRLACHKTIFSKEAKKIEYTTFKPVIGDLTKYKCNDGVPFEERIKNQIDVYNSKVSKETIDGNVIESLSKYVT